MTKDGYVQKELRKVLDIALENPDETIFIIPARLDDCELPRRLRAGTMWIIFRPSGVSGRSSDYWRLCGSVSTSLRRGSSKLLKESIIPH